MPRVAGQSEQWVVGSKSHRHFGLVGLGNRDRSGRSQTTDRRVVDQWDVVGEGGNAKGGGVTGEVQAVLDGERYAGQWPECFASRPCSINGVSRGPSPFGVDPHDSVKPAVHLVDTV